MSSEKITTAEIRETGENAFAVDIAVSGHALKGDEPKENGGGGLGPSPYDLLTAALGECTAMTVRWYARQKNWPLDRVAVTITHRKASASEVPEAKDRIGVVDLFEKSVVIEGASLTPEQRQKLLDVAAKCPVQRTLQGNPVIRTKAD